MMSKQRILAGGKLKRMGGYIDRQTGMLRIQNKYNGREVVGIS